jgi:hypothetical protein
MNTTSGVILCVSDQDLHTGRPITQIDYTRICINTNVLLRKSTELLETY